MFAGGTAGAADAAAAGAAVAWVFAASASRKVNKAFNGNELRSNSMEKRGFVRADEPAPLRSDDPNAGKVVLLRRHRAALEFARALSTIFNPFMTATILWIIVSHAYSKTTVEFWWLSAAGVAFFLVAPLSLILFFFVNGTITNLEVTEQRERQPVFAAFIVNYLVAALILTIADAPRPLIAITWGYVALAVTTMVVTRWFKISTHAFGITGPFAVMFLLFKWQPLPYVALVPLVCWSRIYLREHTFAQVLAGAGMAIAYTLLFFWLFGLLK